MKNATKIFRTKAFFLTYVAVLAAGALWWYANQYIYKPQAAAPKVNITFAAAPQDPVPVNQEQTMQILIDPEETPEFADQKISAFDITIVASGNAQIVSFGVPVDEGSGKPYGVEILKLVAPTQARLVHGDISALASTSSIVRIPITFKGTAGEGTIAVDRDKVEVSGNNPPPDTTYTNDGTMDSFTFTFGEGAPPPDVTATPTPTDEPAPPVEGAIRLNLQTRFQGITGKPKGSDRMVVRVQMAGGALGVALPSTTVTLVSDGNGVFKGAAGFDIPAAAGYYLLVKGPRHIQRKICVATPTEGANNGYRCASKAPGTITLALGDNTIDLTGISLLVGDLPIGDGGAQDGVVNSQDIAFVRQNLSKTDADVLAKGDVNMDGVINTIDYSQILQSLSVKYDEE